MSTLKCSNLQNASAANPAFVLAADGTATANLSSLNGGPLSGMRNRIINGDMRIDQRNAGSAVTIAANGSSYGADRFRCDAPSGQSMTLQRSTTTPSGQGFPYSLAYTAGTASTNASDSSGILHFIEGHNVADLGFGTATAQTAVLSFWVRCSLTGTFGLEFENAAGNRYYLTSYAIAAANTWEKKTITLPGDTTGTWDWASDRGLGIIWDLGFGTTASGTVTNSWGAGNKRGLTGGVKLTQNTGATFYITGVQLEPGSVATPFERRSFGAELALCQRYFLQNVTTASAYNAIFGGFGTCIATTTATLYFSAPVSMRSAPTLAYTGTPRLDDGQAGYTISAMSAGQLNPSTINLNITSAGLTLYRPVKIDGNAGGSIVTLSAEL